MNKFKLFFGAHKDLLIVMLIVGGAVSSFIALMKWVDSDKLERLQKKACTRVCEVGLGNTFDKQVKFHIDTCMAGMKVVEVDFKEIGFPDIAEKYFECMSIGENQEDFDFCHEYKSKRLAQEHYRISREEADE